MGNGAYGKCGHRGQWGTGGMGHMPTGAKWYRCMGHIGNRDTGANGVRDMGHMGNEAHRGYGVQGYEPHGQ